MIQRATRTSTEARQAQFLAELISNGGNASAAARAVGYHPDHGRRLVSRSATVRAALQRIREEAQESIQEWTELVPLAQQRLLELLSSEDERVRLLAAREVLDRALGKATARVQHVVEEHAGMLSDGEVQLALSLMAHYGWTFAQAVDRIREYPEEAERWIAARAVSPTGREGSGARQGRLLCGGRPESPQGVRRMASTSSRDESTAQHMGSPDGGVSTP